jgi:hypothetical protein
MPPWFLGVFVNGLIPFLGGVYATLLAFRVIGSKPGVNPKSDEWHRRWGRFMRVAGPLLVLFGVFLWVTGGIQHSVSTPPAQTVWVRHSTSDGTASAEFPGEPKRETKTAEGVAMNSVSLSLKDQDCHLILSWSAVAREPGVGDDELLDGLKEGIPMQTAKLGTPLSYFSEEKVTVSGRSGRDLRFVSTGSKYTQRMRCVIANGRIYRVVFTARTGSNVGDQERFLDSFRLEMGER